MFPLWHHCGNLTLETGNAKKCRLVGQLNSQGLRTVTGKNGGHIDTGGMNSQAYIGDQWCILVFSLVIR